MRFHAKPTVTLRLIIYAFASHKDKPRIAGPRCGDLALRLGALWRQCPNETQAKRRVQPNRRAVGAAL